VKLSPEHKMVLVARAAVARSLVKAGQLDGELALSYVLEPTARMLAAEAQVNACTLRFRASGQRAYQ